MGIPILEYIRQCTPLEPPEEPSLPDENGEDNPPVAQSPLLRTKEKEAEAVINVRGLPVPHQPRIPADTFSGSHKPTAR